MDEQLVHALPDLGEWVVREEVGCDARVRRLPRLAAVLGAECAGRRDGDVHPVRVLRIELDGVAAHPAGAGVPLVAGLVPDEALNRLPGLAGVVAPEEDAGRPAEPKASVLALASRPDVPRLLEREPRVFRKPQLLGPRPGLAAILGTVHCGAVDEAVRRCVHRAV